MVRSLSVLGLAFGLVACGGSGNLKRYDRTQPNLSIGTGELAPVKGDVDGVLTAGLDPNAATTQLVKASANSAIANTTLAFPPGALGISVDVTIKAGSEAFSSDLAAELGLEGDTGVASGGVPVQIDASKVVSLSQPFTLAIDLPAGAGLVATDLDNLALIYQVKNEGEGRVESGVVPRSELTVKDGQAYYSSFHFGWFRLVYLVSPLKEKKTIANSQAKANKGLMLLQSATQLPACGATDLGVTVYLKAEAKFKTCTANGWEDISLTGPKGDTGATGPAGPTGAPSASYSVLDANGQKIGDFLGMTYAQYSEPMVPVIGGSDGAFFAMSFSGNFSGICATGPCEQETYDYQVSMTTRPTCFFQANNCSGACYIKYQLKNTLARSATNAAPTTYSYWKATVSEGPQTMAAGSTSQSYWDAKGGVCRASTGISISLNTALSPYSFPTGKAPPYATPLSIGKN